VGEWLSPPTTNIRAAGGRAPAAPQADAFAVIEAGERVLGRELRVISPMRRVSSSVAGT
jgi:hypothetical protein